MAGNFLSDDSVRQANQAICDLIEGAKVVYTDAKGQDVMTIDLGHVELGEIITIQVPRPDDLRPI